jgi:hypothetical protein
MKVGEAMAQMAWRWCHFGKRERAFNSSKVMESNEIRELRKKFTISWKP